MNSRERYETTFDVASYETDLNGTLSLFALFNRFQELAGAHAAHLQVGYADLRKSHRVWILARITVKVLSLPLWGDTVQLATWPKGIDRLFAMRDFSLTGTTGETLVLATSAWLLVDLQKNRPMRIENLPVDLQFPGAPHAIQEKPDKIPMPESPGTALERPVWLSDIDVNGHVNNAQYAKWTSDCFVEGEFRDRRISSVQINYLEETLLGDTIGLMKAPENARSSEYLIAGISRGKGSTVFQARVTWA